MADPKDPDLHAEEDEYVSEEDEDFNPDAAAAGENVSSSSESEVGKPVTKGKSGKKAAKQRRRKTSDEEAEDAGFENSGDEGMIEQGRKRKRNGNVDEDSGGEGGFVQTRGMKATAAKDNTQKSLSNLDESVTLDIDAMWREMKAWNLNPNENSLPPSYARLGRETQGLPSDSAQVPEAEEMITIIRTYAFAGETSTKTETVPRSSDAAKAYLAAQAQAEKIKPVASDITPTTPADRPIRYGPNGQVLHRPLRRVSHFDPNPSGIVSNMPTRRMGSQAEDGKSKSWHVVDKSKLNFHGKDTTSRHGKVKEKAPQKMNVVEKSKMDWQAHVDEAGDRNELDAAAKSKGDYLERKRFLDRLNAQKDEETAKTAKK